MVKIEECRACKSKNVDQIFDLGMQPFANALLVDVMQEEKKYPLSISYCKDCSLVQLDYTADPEELFSNYFWVTGTSNTAREYAEIFCAEALKHTSGEVNNYVLEVASNDGTFLSKFANRNIEVLGVDPAKNIAEKANKDGIATRVDFFDRNVAQDIISDKGYPDIVYARNVLPHVADLHGFMQGLQLCTTENNTLILEVHYSGKILEELHYDSIYHEHLCYFTLKSVTNLLEQYNLFPYDLMLSPISGGSIVLYISKKKKEKTYELLQLEKMEELKGYNLHENWVKFAEDSFAHRDRLKEIVLSELEKGKKIIGYGASARSSTMLNFCEIDQRHLVGIIDQNSLKQGMYTPGTHIKIMSKDEAMKKNPETVLLAAWNFKEEIVKTLEECKYDGNIIVPLPNNPNIIESSAGKGKKDV